LEFGAEAGGTAFGGGDPLAGGPGWIVAEMLGVAAVEIGDPVIFGVLMEGDDFAGDRHRKRRFHQGKREARIKAFSQKNREFWGSQLPITLFSGGLLQRTLDER
jgi:hypothetical protein